MPSGVLTALYDEGHTGAIFNEATTLITDGLIGAATLLASAALAGQAHSDPPGWTSMDHDAVARDAKAAESPRTRSASKWLWEMSATGCTTMSPTPRWPGRSPQSSTGHPGATYAVATMARYLCPPERGKLDGYLSASSNPTLHAAAPRY